MPSKKKVAKKKYKVTNWREYNTALKQRGYLTIWISKEIEHNWYAHKAICKKTWKTPEIFRPSNTDDANFKDYI